MAEPEWGCPWCGSNIEPTDNNGVYDVRSHLRRNPAMCVECGGVGAFEDFAIAKAKEGESGG